MRAPRSKPPLPAPRTAKAWRPKQFVVYASRRPQGLRHWQSFAAETKAEAEALYLRAWPGSTILWCAGPDEPLGDTSQEGGQ